LDITDSFAAHALRVVREVAAAEVVPRYRHVDARHKDDGSIVTEADLASQDALARRLSALAPYPVVAEEMPAHEQHAAFAPGGRFWCIDPLDGTRNFADGIPFFSVSVALMEGGRTLFGAVYDPIADEAFHAVRGGGAYLDEAPLRVPPRAPPLARAVAEVGLRRGTNWLRAELKNRPPYARRVTSGSATLSWCHLAAGRIDVMLHGGQRMWDYAAGALVLEEARGALSTLEQDDFWSADPWSRSAVAARDARLLEAWRGWLRARPRPQPTTDLT